VSHADGSAPRRGLLLVWTDIDAAFDGDFNRWYLREHMGERMAIPGFELARRFVAVAGSPRYLALYRTSSPAILRSEAYRSAFANQSEWSRRTFGRMQNTIRRVGAITAWSGGGEGGELTLYVVPADGRCPDGAALDAATSIDGVVAAYVLEPDPELSVPLTVTTSSAAPAPVVFVEGIAPEAVDAAARLLAWKAGSGDAALTRFRHLCSVGRRDGA
jgi:hypothetical protein